MRGEWRGEEEGEELGCEAHTRVIVEGHDGTEAFGGFWRLMCQRAVGSLKG